VGPALYINITFTWRIRITHLATESSAVLFLPVCATMLVMLPLCPTTKLRPALASFSLRFFPFFPHFPPNAVYAPRKLCNLHGGKQKEAPKKWRNAKSDDAAAVVQWGPRLKYSQGQHKSCKRTGAAVGLAKKRGAWVWVLGSSWRTRWPPSPSPTWTSKLKVFEQTLSARSGDVAPTHSKGHAVRVHFVIV